MAIRAVFFDIDGTLVDVGAATARCIAELAARAGALPFPAEDIAVATSATRERRNQLVRWVTKMVVARGGEPQEAARALARVDRFVVPDPRTTAMIDRVRVDLRVGVISNGRRTVQRAKLRAAGLLALIDPNAIFVSGELGVRKPAAAIFERALESTGLDASATLFVGDHEADDIEGARAVGMKTCRVAPPGTATVAEHRVDHVADLEQVLACSI